MKNLPGILLAFIAVNMFYFPVEYSFITVSNSKNLLAVLGAASLLFSFIQRKEFVVSKDILVLLILSTIVNAFTILSVTYNHTPEKSYTEYLVSTSVWLLSAYGACSLIRLAHGRIDFPLLIDYLSTACVFQCIAALLIRFIPEVQTFVDGLFVQGQDILRKADRLYGIGASLDVAGTRFACVLAALPVRLYVEQQKLSRKGLFLLIASYIFVTTVGSIIARTTLVGIAIGLAYLGILFLKDIFSGEASLKGRLAWTWILAIIVVVPAGILLYQTSAEMRSLLRFGFEGFFNLAETGEFRTSSSDFLLNKMTIFPEEAKTYLIGDGYFENSRNDINYLGDATMMGFYMGTDIGYLRFIFLFGVPGLIAISLVMIYAALTAAKSFPKHKWAFYLALICGFVIWFKVATDVFPFLAIGIAAGLVKDLIDFNQETEPDSESI